MDKERYEARISRAIALIDRQIDQDLSIERLADASLPVAIPHCYFAAVNPGFGINGQPVDAGTQALIRFVGSLVLGPIVTLIVVAVVGRRSQPTD